MLEVAEPDDKFIAGSFFAYPPPSSSWYVLGVFWDGCPFQLMEIKALHGVKSRVIVSSREGKASRRLRIMT